MMEQKAVYVVKADWDDEIRRWTATSDDIPGLVVEADTLEDVMEIVEDLAPDLLESNCNIDLPEVPLFVQANYATTVKTSHT